MQDVVRRRASTMRACCAVLLQQQLASMCGCVSQPLAGYMTSMLCGHVYLFCCGDFAVFVSCAEQWPYANRCFMHGIVTPRPGYCKCVFEPRWCSLGLTDCPTCADLSAVIVCDLKVLLVGHMTRAACSCTSWYLVA